MPLPVIPGVVRVSLVGTIRGGGRWSNTLHFRRSDLATPDQGQLDALDLLLVDFYDTQIMGRCAPGTTIEATEYTPLDGSSGAILVGHTSNGADTFETMPPEVAQVLTIRTALRGRQNRGRVFTPAFTVSSYDGDGKIMTSVITSILAGTVSLRAALTVAGWELGVASYGRSVKVNHTTTPKTFVVTTWTPHFTACTSCTMDVKADVIRSRKD